MLNRERPSLPPEKSRQVLGVGRFQNGTDRAQMDTPLLMQLALITLQYLSLNFVMIEFYH
jgi:hypothetical protein